MYRALRNLMIAIVTVAAWPLTAAAQPTVTIGSDSGVPTQTVVIPVNYSNAGSDVAGVDIDIFFPPSQFSSVTIDCTVQTVGATNNFCSNSAAGSGRVDLILARLGGGALTNGLMANISFTIAGGATPAAEALDGVVVGVSDSSGLDLPNNTITMVDGTLTIQGPTYSSTPAPGALNVGSAQVNTGDPSVNVVIDNTGAAGTTLTGTCSETSDPSNVFTLSGDTDFTVPESGPNDTVTVTCSDNTIGNFSGQMTCTHDGTNGPSAVYSLSCSITAGPQPAYTSSPIPGTTLDFGTTPKGDADPAESIDISNTGDATTTLTGTCSITNPAGTPFYFTSDGAFSIDQGAGTDTVEVACDTDVTGTHSGELSCSHDGSNLPNPATYPLTCTIPPEPNIATIPVPGSTIDLGSVPQNNTDPTGNLTIANNGDPASTLSGTCSLTAGTTPISISTGGGAYSVPEAGPDHIVTLSCDSSRPPGSYSDTLSCTHDDPDGDPTSPVTYTVDCQIQQPDPAVYGSTPTSGSTIDITQGLDVVVGDPAPTAILEIRNDADAGDADMDLSCSLINVTGTAISDSPVVANAILSPGDSLDVTFTCDTATASAVGTPFEANYGCNWDSVPVPGAPAGVPMSFDENYTVTCEVREAESDVEPQTPDGTTVTEEVDQGGTATYSFVFEEVNDEGVDGELTCSLADETTGFTIVSPGFPAAVPAGDSVTVNVEGTDPGGVDSTSDTLNCTYTDSNNPEGVQVSYELVLLIGGNATFMVTKDFTDDNPGEVLVTIECTTGLPIQQSQELVEGSFVKFIVVEFDSGEMNCTVTEDVPNGYSADYDASGSDSSFVDGDPENPGCQYIEVAGGDDNFCHIINSPDAVEVVITKDWVIEGMDDPDGISTEYELTLFCDSEIVGGSQAGGQPLGENPQLIEIDPCFLVPSKQEGVQTLSADWCKTFEGNGPEVFTAEVIPAYPSTDCHVEEQIFDNAVEVDNGCTAITVSAGQGASCTVTNTVFFEGIPTLSQYGMAIMALLMLGIGLVGFRRYA